MRIDVRPVGKLRGQDPVDLVGALTPVIEALRASSVDLSRVRIVCDWIQYRARRALRFVASERLSVNPDCGLRHLPPGVARAKLAVMVAGAAEVRAELGDAPA
jgi:hypothetical protein